jgi:transposase
MPLPFVLDLSPEHHTELEQVRDHAPKPYLRERAAAILKVAAGQSVRAVARSGLFRPRHHDTVGAWVQRYQADGVDGLQIRPGRGRKPAFSPSVRLRSRR